MDAAHHLVPVEDAHRPPYPVGPGRRRPSGREPAAHARPPRSIWGWSALLAGCVTAAALFVATSTRPGPVQAVDRQVREQLAGSARVQELAHDMQALGSTLGYRALWIPTVVVLVVVARWRHLIVYLATISFVAAVAQLSAGDSATLRAVRAGVTGSPDGVVVPAWPVVVLSTVATASLVVLTPAGRARRWGWAGVAVPVLVLAAARITLGEDSASATAVSAALGVSAAALAFLVFAPEGEFPVTYRREVKAHLRLDAERTRRIVSAVHRQLGIELAGIEPYRLNGSAGSTPCRLRLASGPPEFLFGKLYATSHLRSDRWYKFARALLYGRLEDEKPFSSVRKLVEHEDYMLRLFRDGGVRVPAAVGVAEIVPSREYLLVTELVPDAVEICESDLGEPVLDDALRQVRRLWDAGVAHRDVKPSNVLVRGEDVYVVDVAFGELRPSRWRELVDLANMMLTLAVVVGPQEVLDRALRLFDPDDLAEAFAATGSVTVPRQLRRLIAAGGRDLVAEFRALLPGHPPIAIQRWSLRRVLLALGTVGGMLAALVLVALNLRAGGLL